MTQEIQIIECAFTANKDYLQSLLAVGFYAIAVQEDIQQISNQLDFSNTQTKIIRLKEDDEIAIKKLAKLPLLHNLNNVCLYNIACVAATTPANQKPSLPWRLSAERHLPLRCALQVVPL